MTPSSQEVQQVQDLVFAACAGVAPRFHTLPKDIFPDVLNDVMVRLLRVEIHTSMEGFVRRSARFLARRACLQARGRGESANANFDDYPERDWERHDPSWLAERRELLAFLEKAKANLPSPIRGAVEVWQGARGRDRAVECYAAERNIKRDEVYRMVHRGLDEIRRGVPKDRG